MGFFKTPEELEAEKKNAPTQVEEELQFEPKNEPKAAASKTEKKKETEPLVPDTTRTVKAAEPATAEKPVESVAQKIKKTIAKVRVPKGTNYYYEYTSSDADAKDNPEKGMSKIGKDLDFASSEAYNMLRSSLEFTCMSETGHGKVIGITSACPQEGKSLTSINLSYAIAKKGHKVLLIEGDLRRPTISKVLNLKKSPGLTNYLVDDMGSVVYTKILHDNMSVITSGDIPPNPSELIGSKRMEATLLKLSAQYDYIIVDLPPVNAVSDAFAVSSFLDGVILIVKHKFTRRGELMEAYRQLEFAGAKILGVVYNGYVQDGGYYYRKSRYRYYKKYGYKGSYKYYRRGGHYYDRYGYDYGYGYGYGEEHERD